MIRYLILLLIPLTVYAATTSIKDNVLKLGAKDSQDVYIYANNGNTNPPFIFFDFSEGTWKQSNDGTSTEIIGGASVITTEGDLILGNASGEESRLPIDPIVGRLLTSNGTTAVWQDPPISTTLNAKGQLQGYSTQNANVGPCADGQFIVYDDAEATGWKCSDELQGALNPVTDWQTGTCSSSWTNTTTSCKYKRIGDSMHIQYTLAFSAAPTGGDLYLYPPTGFTIDGTKMNGNFSLTNGFSLIDAGTRGYAAVGKVEVTQNRISITHTESGNFGSVNETNPFSVVSGDIISGDIVVPIVGWSSGVDAVAQFKTLDESTIDTFSAYIQTNNPTTAVTNQSYPNWVSCTRTGPGTTNCVYSAALQASLTNAMNCVPKVYGAGAAASNYNVDVSVATASGFTYTTSIAGAASDGVGTYIICNKAHPDSNKIALIASAIDSQKWECTQNNLTASFNPVSVPATISDLTFSGLVTGKKYYYHVKLQLGGTTGAVTDKQWEGEVLHDGNKYSDLIFRVQNSGTTRAIVSDSFFFTATGAGVGVNLNVRQNMQVFGDINGAASKATLCLLPDNYQIPAGI